MPINLPDMRLAVGRPLGLNVGGTQLPTNQVDLNLNRAFWEIQNKFPFREKEAVSTFPTVVGVRNYEVAFPTEAISHLSIEELTDEGKHGPLDQITRDVYEQEYKTWEDQWGIPIAYVREGCIIRLLPTPDEIYTITMKRQIALSDLSNTQIVSGIPQVWDEIIVFGGLWRTCIDIGDLARADWYKRLQNEMINTIIPTEVNESQSNSQLAAVTVLGLDYD